MDSPAKSRQPRLAVLTGLNRPVYNWGLCFYGAILMEPTAFLHCQTPSDDDIAAIVELDQRCLGGLWSADGYRRELNSPNSVLQMLTFATASEAPIPIGIGCFWEILDEAHITVLGIDPAYQGQGLGQWLLLRLLAGAAERQLKHATLEVRASNQRALQLYQKYAFRCVGERRRYYRDGEDALILWYNGLQTADFAQILAQQRQQIQSRLMDQGWQLSVEKYPVNRT